MAQVFIGALAHLYKQQQQPQQRARSVVRPSSSEQSQKCMATSGTPSRVTTAHPWVTDGMRLWALLDGRQHCEILMRLKNFRTSLSLRETEEQDDSSAITDAFSLTGGAGPGEGSMLSSLGSHSERVLDRLDSDLSKCATMMAEDRTQHSDPVSKREKENAVDKETSKGSPGKGKGKGDGDKQGRKVAYRTSPSSPVTTGDGVASRARSTKAHSPSPSPFVSSSSSPAKSSSASHTPGPTPTTPSSSSLLSPRGSQSPASSSPSSGGKKRGGLRKRRSKGRGISVGRDADEKPAAIREVVRDLAAALLTALGLDDGEGSHLPLPRAHPFEQLLVHPHAPADTNDVNSAAGARVTFKMSADVAAQLLQRALSGHGVLDLTRYGVLEMEKGGKAEAKEKGNNSSTVIANTTKSEEVFAVSSPLVGPQPPPREQVPQGDCQDARVGQVDCPTALARGVGYALSNSIEVNALTLRMCRECAWCAAHHAHAHLQNAPLACSPLARTNNYR